MIKLTSFGPFPSQTDKINFLCEKSEMSHIEILAVLTDIRRLISSEKSQIDL